MRKIIFIMIVVVLLFFTYLSFRNILKSSNTKKKNVGEVKEIRKVTPEENTNQEVIVDRLEEKEEVQTVEVGDTFDQNYLSIIGIIILGSGFYYVKRKA